MLAFANIAGMGAAVPHMLRTEDPVEWLAYESIITRTLRLKADAAKKQKP